MKKHTINEYISSAYSGNQTRIVVYPDNDTAFQLLTYHKKNDAIEISISECVGDSVNLSMPDVVMRKMDEKILRTEQTTIITGIDSYLILLNNENISRFIIALRKRVDDSKLNTVYLLTQTHLADIFSHPQYEDTLSVFCIAGGGQEFAPTIVTIVPDKWVQVGNNANTWSALLRKLGQFIPFENHTLVLSGWNNKQAGLSEHVSQLFEIECIAHRYYGILQKLPPNVLEKLITKCSEQSSKPLAVLKELFGEENANPRLAVKRLVELQSDELWIAYVWYVTQNVDATSYLVKVLKNNVSPSDFLRKYVVETAVDCLTNDKALNLAKERANAIQELVTVSTSLIIEFIGVTKEYSNDNVAAWLNCGTEAELIEIIRRVSETDLTFGLPKIWKSLYLTLADYLTDDFDYDNKELTEYFREYRRQKIKNFVTDGFVKTAFDIEISPTFVTRDSILQKLSGDTNTALLIVDGMGAEYYPLILAMAKRRGMNIEFSAVANARLPSSTRFNAVKWNERRCLKPNIYRIDTISHEGARKHEQCSSEENIVATFAVFENMFNRIAEAINSYDRVVVTADHGSSRLAVLAYKQQLSTKLHWEGEIQSGRYVIAPPNMPKPSEFESYYDADGNISYWVVRGYNCLRSGTLSVHGGASIEERLVPVVVFSKTKTSTQVQIPVAKPTVDQLIEKTGFDDI